MFTPLMSFASSTEHSIERTVFSILTTEPFLRPWLGWLPIPIISVSLSGCLRPTMVQTFVVPTSSPTTISFSFIGILPFTPTPWPNVNKKRS